MASLSTSSNNEDLEISLLSQIRKECAEKNVQFLNEKKLVISDSTTSLWVCQKEMGTVYMKSVLNDRPYPRYIGSSDATTCVLLFLYTDKSFSCAHYDSLSCVKASLKAQVESLLYDEAAIIKNINVSMVGGYNADGLEEGFLISNGIVKELKVVTKALNLNTEYDVVFVCDDNRMKNEKYKDKHKPIFTDAVFDSIEKKIIPCVWENLPLITPEYRYRCASLWTSGQSGGDYDGCKHVYDWNENVIKISNRPYSTFHQRFVNYVLSNEVEDEELLLQLSTSPYGEPSHFVLELKATFRFFKEYPNHNEYHNKVMGGVDRHYYIKPSLVGGKSTIHIDEDAVQQKPPPSYSWKKLVV
jgi:hypothetical protein